MKLRPSRLRFIHHYASIIIPLLTPNHLINWALLFSGGLVLRAELKRLSSKYLVDNDELILERGLISRERVSVRLKDIVKVGVKQGIIERLLGFGDLEIETKSTPIKLTSVFRPQLIADRIKELRSNEL